MSQNQADPETIEVLRAISRGFDFKARQLYHQMKNRAEESSPDPKEVFRLHLVSETMFGIAVALERAANDLEN